jgi:Tfp pilus assembly protein PilV
MSIISKDQKGFTAVEALLIILILAVIGFGGYYVYHTNHKTKTVSTTTTAEKTSSQKTSATTPSSTSSQDTENSNNTARTNDANTILATIDTFESNNESEFPSTISQASSSSVYFCNANCNSSNSSAAGLSYYKPTNIYDEESVSGLASTIPNDNTVYVIDNAICNNNAFTGAEAGGTFVVAYALQNGNGITQKCLTDL